MIVQIFIKWKGKEVKFSKKKINQWIFERARIGLPNISKYPILFSCNWNSPAIRLWNSTRNISVKLPAVQFETWNSILHKTLWLDNKTHVQKCHFLTYLVNKNEKRKKNRKNKIRLFQDFLRGGFVRVKMNQMAHLFPYIKLWSATFSLNFFKTIFTLSSENTTQAIFMTPMTFGPILWLLCPVNTLPWKVLLQMGQPTWPTISHWSQPYPYTPSSHSVLLNFSTFHSRFLSYQ